MDKKKTGLSAFSLKITALILMTLDHIGYFIPGAPFVLRVIGRLSAPVFFFVAANSLAHTSDRRLFIFRLYIASASMELTKMIVFFFDADSRYIVTNNIFTTIFYAVFLANQISTAIHQYRQKEWRKFFEAAVLVAFPVIWTLVAIPRSGFTGWTLKAILPTLTQAEGGVSWIFLGVCLCLLINNKKALVGFYCAYCSILALQAFSYASVISPFGSNIQWMMIFALPLFLLYNGEKGPGFKWLFYAYYPVHIWILYFIGRIV
ncbi:MAG: conjugal transfer protein TraX, partial [Oscillospiraceae bacterium]|nr:conjugal transfer protein TraX [Oscillospiraceae bacterium]